MANLVDYNIKNSLVLLPNCSRQTFCFKGLGLGLFQRSNMFICFKNETSFCRLHSRKTNLLHKAVCVL